jgi:multiple sugar transport system permease protein
VVATIIPILWMLVIAFNQPRSIVAPVFAFNFSLENFQALFGIGTYFGAQVLNSVVLVVFATFFSVLIGTLAGYSFSQLGWSRRTVLAVLSAAALMQIIPPMTLVPGLYVTLTGYNLVGGLGGLILLNIVFNLPFATIMMKFYCDSLPKELREAAKIDGASEFGAFRRVMLPLAMPGMAAVSIFTAIQVWNEFLFALVFTTGGDSAPITVGIAALLQPYAAQFGPLAAVGVVTAVPIILLAVVANRQIVSGLTGGAVKG